MRVFDHGGFRQALLGQCCDVQEEVRIPGAVSEGFQLFHDLRQDVAATGEPTCQSVEVVKVGVCRVGDEGVF
mgnify:FL=1